MSDIREPDGTFSTKLWCGIHNCERLVSVGARTQTYCRACNRERAAAWRRTERGRKTLAAYKEENRDRINAKTLEWYRANRSRAIARATRYRNELRRVVFEAYGNKCFCCGETIWEFLEVDHINRGGRKHRNSGRDGRFRTRDVYADIRREGFPKDEYRLACSNCNSALGHYGYCPHQQKIGGSSH